MNRGGLKRRLNKLERGSGGGDAVLRFSDGTTIAMTVRDPLGLVLASFRRAHARDTGHEVTESPYSRALDLLQKVECVDCPAEPLIKLAHDVLHSQGVSE